MSELDEFGKRVWKHKINKRLFLEQSYGWKEHVILIDETEGRQVIDSFDLDTFNFDAWTPMNRDEFNSVKSYYKEIYE
jgi:hypothetical protein